MSLEEYKQLLGKIFQILPPNIVIHRLIGDAPAKYLLAPLWVRQKAKVILEINNYLSGKEKN
jgi:radical SAM superfamily enzyme